MSCLRVQVLGRSSDVVAVALKLLPALLVVPPDRPVEKSLRSPGCHAPLRLLCLVTASRTPSLLWQINSTELAGIFRECP
jgi:hypothetical protein